MRLRVVPLTGVVADILPTCEGPAIFHRSFRERQAWKTRVDADGSGALASRVDKRCPASRVRALSSGCIGGALIRLSCGTKGDGSGWHMHIVASGSIMLFAFQAGCWVFTSDYLRYLLLGLLGVAIGFNHRHNWRGQSRKPASVSPSTSCRESLPFCFWH